MSFKLWDRVIIKANPEEKKNKLFQLIDGATGKITEIYYNEYEPEVERYEIKLDEFIEYEGNSMRIIPGLYADNLQKNEKPDNKVKENRTVPFAVFESYVDGKLESEWYFGLADCLGIESFIKEPEESKDWEDIDYMFDMGMLPDNSSVTPGKKQFNMHVNMLMRRAHANSGRHPVVYRVKLNPRDVLAIQKLIKIGDDEGALVLLKEVAEVVQLARGLGSNLQSRWDKIPNPELDPMH